MEYCKFTTEKEILEAVEAVKQMEKECYIKFSKKEFDKRMENNTFSIWTNVDID